MSTANCPCMLAALCIAAVLLAPNLARADEGGANLYLTGSYASMAAVPGEPGWSYIGLYYHATASLGSASINADLGYGVLAYSFATPVLDGQLTLSVAGAVGNSEVTVAGTQDSRLGYNDLAPQAALRWNDGVNSYMAYTQVNIPVGTYDTTRLANFGLGHWGIDSGAGYTYFDPATGWEFSAVPGLTVNFQNPNTQYRNGIDGHIDLAASKLLTEHFQAGLVGYYYGQLTRDKSLTPVPDGFKTRVAAIGPQVGYLFAAGDEQGYINVKGYHEFAFQNRPGGWNFWLGISFSPKAP